MIRILLVDDHAVVRAGYRQLLECAPEYTVVAEAASAAAGYRRFLECAPDVVITDLSLPGVGGIELLRRLRARQPELRALAFSVHEESMFVERALAAGALGYVSKRSAADTLVAAVDAVSHGREFLSPDLARTGPSRRQTNDVLHKLSQREFEIFRQVAEGHSVREIATGLCISGKTVSNHYSQIRVKLGLRSAAEMARLAIVAGVVRV
ncbi:response regulator transcription factor [uncultured Nevskia sp.]|uniref:response regulator n=1 Tax=uncultured Nevskia sp. TaxID=228950 RepID=UPI0025F4DB63|nr:response regulator transcription factor [uncultured Nevskia sp.]